MVTLGIIERNKIVRLSRSASSINNAEENDLQVEEEKCTEKIIKDVDANEKIALSFPQPAMSGLNTYFVKKENCSCRMQQEMDNR